MTPPARETLEKCLKVLQILKMRGEPLSTKELRKLTGMSSRELYNILSYLRRKGLIERYVETRRLIFWSIKDVEEVRKFEEEALLKIKSIAKLKNLH